VDVILRYLYIDFKHYIDKDYNLDYNNLDYNKLHGD